MIKALRAKWLSRRRELAMKQLEAEANTPDPAAIPLSDMMTTGHFMSQQALGGFLNPKAKTKTEWKGD